MKRVLMVVVVMLSTGNVLAQQEADRTVYQQRTHIEFGEGDALTGYREGPGDVFITIRKKTRFKNMIQIRGNFHDKIAESAAGL